MKYVLSIMALFVIITFFVAPNSSENDGVYLSKDGINLVVKNDYIFPDYKKIYAALIADGWRRDKLCDNCNKGITFSISCASDEKGKILIISSRKEGCGYGTFLKNKAINPQRVIAVLHTLAEEHVANAKWSNS